MLYNLKIISVHHNHYVILTALKSLGAPHHLNSYVLHVCVVLEHVVLVVSAVFLSLFFSMRHAVNSLNYFNHHQTPPSFGPSLTSRSHHHLTMTPPHTPVRKSVSISPPPSAPPIVSSSQSAFSFPFSSPLPEESATPSSPPSQIIRCATSPVKVVSPHTQVRRSSDSDVSNITPPKGRSHHNTVNVLNLAVNSVVYLAECGFC